MDPQIYHLRSNLYRNLQKTPQKGKLFQRNCTVIFGLWAIQTSCSPCVLEIRQTKVGRPNSNIQLRKCVRPVGGETWRARRRGVRWDAARCVRVCVNASRAADATASGQ